jgi:hypothetical protein
MESTRPNLVIHIGPHKTGTTAIQQFCADNRERLLELGLDYTEVGRGSRTPAHHRMAAIFLEGDRDLRRAERPLNPRRGRPEPDARESRRRIHGTWEDLAAHVRRHPGMCTIVSAEALSGFKPAHIAALQQTLDGIRIRIVLYLRPQWELIPSIYVQRLKAGSIRQSLQEYIDEALTARQGSFSAMIDTWSRLAPDGIVARVFQRGRLVDDDVVSDFLSVVGVDEVQRKALPAPQRLNSSPSAKTLYVLHRLQDPSLRGRRRSESYRDSVMLPIWRASEELGWNKTSANLLSSRQLLHIAKAFADDNHAVALKLGLPDGKLFDPPTDKGGKTVTAEQKPDTDELLELARRAMVLSGERLQRQIRAQQRRAARRAGRGDDVVEDAAEAEEVDRR